MMMEEAGSDVIDLGIDAPVERFAEARARTGGHMGASDCHHARDEGSDGASEAGRTYELE